jgi:hypothetical protein
MSFRNRFGSVMRSVLPRPVPTRGLIREKRLVAALFDPRWSGEPPRLIADEGELEKMASALRDAKRIGDFVQLYLEKAENLLTLEFEGRTLRTIRVGRPAERLGSSSFLVEMDGGVFVASGRELGFLFAPQPEASAVAVASGTP